tara:strand:- start:185395 stop:185973 length:579 start_codon:yes stop_codon:yes gene_type:complete
MYFKQPTSDEVARFLQRQSRAELNYPHVGMTGNDRVPDGYDFDFVEIELGQGREVFEAARRAIQQWQQFDVGWAKAVPVSTPIRNGEVIAIRARMVGVWAMAACRIISTVDEDTDRCRRMGFTFGTLAAHPEQGEEQFEIEQTGAGEVVYRIKAVFRANYFAARLSWPYLRYRFNLFRRESADAMCRSVARQ